MITIYHNPRCSKSRATLALLQERNIEPEVILYLQNPPDASTLLELCALIGCPLSEVVRTGETVYRELGLGVNTLTDAELAEIMVSNPVLLERPIVVSGNGAVVGRPPENVLKLL